ncbi:MAG: DinB family protein [Chitinophagaceae bacterium]
MKEILEQYATYNLWANQRLINCILLLPEEQRVRESLSSFSSLHKTLLHLWYANSIWWQRMRMQEIIVDPTVTFKGTTEDAAMALIQQDKTWESWVHYASLAALEHVFHYQNTKREQFKQPVYQVLMHLFNHGTYHRGQIVTTLHQLNVVKIPPTDFIVWSRGK